jgi:hypothetical protein
MVTRLLLGLFALGAAGALASACTGSAAKALDGLPGRWFWLLLVIYAGDAAVGENRPLWERGGKGIAVALFAAAAAIGWLRVRRSRRLSHPEPDPAS